MDKVSSQWIYLMYFNVILSKMSKETPKIQSKLTDLEKVRWTRLDHRLSFVSFESLWCVFQCFRDVISIFFYSYIRVCGGICQNIRICCILSVIC